MGQTFELEPVHANGARVDDGERDLLHGFMDELDTMRARVAAFPNEDPSDILATISGVSGRLAEVRALLYRRNSPRCTSLRTREVDPLREELELQFKIWSRKIALLEWELRMSGGGI